MKLPIIRPENAKNDTFWSLLTAGAYLAIAAVVLSSILIYCSSRSLVDSLIPEVMALGLAGFILLLAASSVED